MAQDASFCGPPNPMVMQFEVWTLACPLGPSPAANFDQRLGSRQEYACPRQADLDFVIPLPSPAQDRKAPEPRIGALDSNCTTAPNPNRSGHKTQFQREENSGERSNRCFESPKAETNCDRSFESCDLKADWMANRVLVERIDPSILGIR
jgi:hypothetical protein